MTLGRFSTKGKRLPRRYGKCNCICHRQAGVKHVGACCRPSDKLLRLSDLRSRPGEKCSGPARARQKEWIKQQQEEKDMTLIGPSFEEAEFLPEAYGGCTCDCHRIPNVFHCMPCCYPVDDISPVSPEIEKILKDTKEIIKEVNADSKERNDNIEAYERAKQIKDERE